MNLSNPFPASTSQSAHLPTGAGAKISSNVDRFSHLEFQPAQPAHVEHLAQRMLSGAPIEAFPAV